MLSEWRSKQFYKAKKDKKTTNNGDTTVFKFVAPPSDGFGMSGIMFVVAVLEIVDMVSYGAIEVSEERGQYVVYVVTLFSETIVMTVWPVVIGTSIHL